MIEKIIETLQSFGLKKVLAYLDADPDQNLPKILDWVERFDKDGIVKDKLQVFRDILADQNNNWYKLLKSLWSEIDDGVRKRIFENYIINEAIVGHPKSV